MCEAAVGCSHSFLALCQRWAQRWNSLPTLATVAITTQKFRAVFSIAIHWGFWSLWCGEVASLYALRDVLGSRGKTMTDNNDSSRLLSIEMQSAGLISCFQWAACFTKKVVSWLQPSLHTVLNGPASSGAAPSFMLAGALCSTALSQAPLARVIKGGLKMDLWQLHSYFSTSCML